MTTELQIEKMVGNVEAKLIEVSKKADEEQKAVGKLSVETKAAIENLGNEQKELADRILAFEQKS